VPQTTAVPPADAVAAAEQEAAQAEQQFATLEERVREGDDTVTPAALTEQREAGRFARLRVEAARRKAVRQQQEEAARQQAAARAQVRAEVADDTNSTSHIEDKLAAFQQAAREFLNAAQDHNGRVTRWARLIGSGGVTPTHGCQPNADGLGHNMHHTAARVDGRLFTFIPGGAVISAALYEVAEEYPHDFAKDASGFQPGQPLRESATLHEVIRRAAR
jgi:hypothetical protein